MGYHGDAFLLFPFFCSKGDSSFMVTESHATLDEDDAMITGKKEQKRRRVYTVMYIYGEEKKK